MLILTLKLDPYSNPNHNPNRTYPNKPTEPYQTALTLTDTVDLQCVLSDRHTSRLGLVLGLGCRVSAMV